MPTRWPARSGSTADAPGRGAGQWGGVVEPRSWPGSGWRRRQREGRRDQRPDHGRAGARARPGRRPVRLRHRPASSAATPSTPPRCCCPAPWRRYEYKAGPAGGDGRGAVRRRPAAELAGCRLAGAQPARRAAQITRVTDRLATFLTLAGPHRAAQRRPGHRAHHRDAPRTADRHHRHAQEPGCVRRAGVPRSIWRR